MKPIKLLAITCIGLAISGCEIPGISMTPETSASTSGYAISAKPVPSQPLAEIEKPSEQNPRKIIHISPKRNRITDKKDITIMFDGSIMPLSNSQKSRKFIEENVKIMPPIEGDWQAVGNQGIKFQPSERWPTESKYQVVMSPKIAGVELIEVFSTNKLQVRNLFDQDLIRRKPLTVIFNDEITLEEAAKLQIRLAGSDEIAPIQFDVAHGERENYETGELEMETDLRRIVMTPRSDWPGSKTDETQERRAFELVVPAGFRANRSNVGTLGIMTKRFTTIDRFSVRMRKPYEAESRLSVDFSAPIEISDLQKYIDIDPVPKNWDAAKYFEKVTEHSYEGRNFYLPAPGDYWDPRTEYEIIVDPDLTDIHGRAITGDTDFSFQTRFRDEVDPVFFPNRSSVIFPDTDLAFGFTYRGKFNQAHIRFGNQSKVIDLPSAVEVPQFYKFNIAELFPESVSDGKFETGVFPVSIEFLKPQTSDHYPWHPKFSARIFVADFMVGMKKSVVGIEQNTAKYEFAIPSEISLEEEIIPVTRLEEVGNYDDLNLRERAPHQLSKDDLSLILPENMSHDFFRVAVGDQIGYGSMAFNQGMASYDMGVDTSGSWYNNASMAHLITDRPLYKQNQTVNFKGFWRNKQIGQKDSPLKPVDVSSTPSYRILVKNPHWETIEVIKGTVKDGQFWGSFSIPADAPLGQYRLMLEDSKSRNLSDISFFVEKFRKPKFLIQAEFADPIAQWQEKAIANIKAEYAFGGALVDRKVRYTVTLQGDQPCMWWCWMPNSTEKSITSGTLQLDENGELQIPIDLDLEFSEAESKTIWNLLNLQITVIESADEQSTRLISVPFAQTNIDWVIENRRSFYSADESATIKGRLVNRLDELEFVQNQSIKAIIAQRKYIRSDRKRSNGGFYGEWDEVIEPLQTLSVKTDENGFFNLDFQTPKNGGSYILQLSTVDAKNRVSNHELNFWVSGADSAFFRENDQNRIVHLFPEQQSYKPGEKVEIFVPMQGFVPTKATATLERAQVLESLDFDLETSTFHFIAEEWMAPNIYGSVTIEGRNSLGDLDIRTGSVSIPVESDRHKLNIQITPTADIYQPGDEVVLDLKTTIQDQPVPAQITVAVVDETLLALKSRPSVDLWAKFWRAVPLGINNSHSLAHLISVRKMEKVQEQLDQVQAEFAAMSEKGGGGGGKADSFKPRGDFRDTAHFVGLIETDVDGNSRVRFKAPDNLTTWNIWALGATLDNAFGQVESNIQVTLPLLISEIMPNFFQSGDQVDIGLLIQRNIDENEEAVEVEIKLPEGFETPKTTQKIKISDQARVFFPIAVSSDYYIDLIEPETLEFVFQIESESGMSDQVVLKRAIHPPVVELTAAEAIRVTQPEFVPVEFDFGRSLARSISVQSFVSLADKLPSFLSVLSNKDYGCTEQILSRVGAELVHHKYQKNIDRAVEKIDVEVLRTKRAKIRKSIKNDGGLGFWSRSQNSSVWVTARFIEQADLWAEFGVPFPAEDIKNAQQWIRKQVLRTCSPQNCLNPTTRQYAAWTLYKKGELGIGELDFLSREIEDGIESKIWWVKSALEVEKTKKLSPEQKKVKKQFVAEIQDELIVRDRYAFWEAERSYFYAQSPRLTAIALDLMIELDELSKFHPDIARYLVEYPTKKLSNNSAYYLLESVLNYAQKYESNSVGAEFELKLSQGDKQKKWANVTLPKITSTDTQTQKIDHKKFNGIEIVPNNKKPFYADIVLREVLPTSEITQTRKGFGIERHIEDMDGHTIDPSELIQGQNYKIKITVNTLNSHQQVRVDIPIPSGAEIVNSHLDNVVGQAPKQDCQYWCPDYPTHHEFHYEKAQYFYDYLSPGSHEIEFMIQARLPGKFEWVPAIVEEMYYPEVMGATAGGEIKITK